MDVYHCSLCHKSVSNKLLDIKNIPVFQNKVYSNRNNALDVPIGNITLMQCQACGHIFNGGFHSEIMKYDENYQNEQSNSKVFQDHLSKVMEILTAYGISSKKVVEIGCGKGWFLHELAKLGIQVTGFDPAYEGNSPYIVKDIFREQYEIQADLLILRHTLEHIVSPMNFLHQIAKANKYNGKIYIEVPDFKWIFKHQAIEDFSYEHCNYFTLPTLSMLFESMDSGYLFGGQYIYSIADLQDLKGNEKIWRKTGFSSNYKTLANIFHDRVKRYKDLALSGNVAIWGAGAKGANFLNFVDPKYQLVLCAIDINSKKQGKYIGGTGHPIIAPEEISQYDVKTVIVMNANYIEEVRYTLSNTNINIVGLNTL